MQKILRKLTTMKSNKRILFIAALLSIFIFSACTKKNHEIKITSLGNCGFLYEHHSTKVLIDAFGNKFGNLFQLPEKDTRTNIEQGDAPFDNINLVLITHRHGDHFDPFLAAQFLKNNSYTMMICPPQVYNEMKDSCRNFSQVEAQIISPEILINNTKNLTANNVSLTAIRLQHGTNRSLEGVAFEDYSDYEKTENFGYLINLGEKVIFHQGDACLKINREALNKIHKKVNIAHLSYFDWDSNSYQLLKNQLQADTVVFMHGTIPGKELQKEELKAIESKLVFFNHLMETKIFE